MYDYKAVPCTLLNAVNGSRRVGEDPPLELIPFREFPNIRICGEIIMPGELFLFRCRGVRGRISEIYPAGCTMATLWPSSILSPRDIRGIELFSPWSSRRAPCAPCKQRIIRETGSVSRDGPVKKKKKREGVPTVSNVSANSMATNSRRKATAAVAATTWECRGTNIPECGSALSVRMSCRCERTRNPVGKTRGKKVEKIMNAD